MPFRIGVYICHCGVNIAGKVRVTEVVDFASTLSNVIVARDYKFMCSDPGQEMIEADIREHRLNRVVVASCSPRLHEKTFQGACMRAGLNPYLFQMASIREQVSWVTEDEDSATRKAKTLVAGAVRRVSFHTRLNTREVDVHPDVLVVGGGISGMQAALDIADAGHHVFLVEQAPTIGGHMLQFDKTFPTLDCAACIGTPKMVSVGQHPNISLLTYSEVKQVEGFVGNYHVTVACKPRYVREDKCTGCGACTEACPVELDSEYDEGLNKRKAIYRSFPQAVPLTFCIDKKDTAPCSRTCPAGVNVHGYVRLISQGKTEQAVRLIMEKIPLPGVLGRVCPHPCEDACRRSSVDEAIAIRELKRFAADQIDWDSLPIPEIKDQDQKIAVIGSGPAGLSAAWFLRLMGYAVTLFEKLPVLGGMLRVGIPDYRLPPEILDREIRTLLRTGIHVRTGVAFGTDITLADLAAEDFSAVFIGTGAHQGLKLQIPGETEGRGVMDAISFLRTVNMGQREKAGERVVVIGGGNVAVDAAGVAKRLGSSEATILYRRSREEMPAWEEEIDAVIAEGVALQCLVAPIRVCREQGRVVGLECLRTELGPPDQSGRRRPVPVEGSEFTISCDAVITAIGQQTDRSWAESIPELQWKKQGTLLVSENTMQTGLPHVFAGGDVVSGPATVVQAIAAGHQAADGIHRFLQEEEAAGVPEEERLEAGEQNNWRPISPEENHLPRAAVKLLDPVQRAMNFDEINPGLNPDQAVAEADRCLNCGGCCECMECVQACEVAAIEHQMKGETREIEVGTIIVATGFDLMDPSPLKQFGYGRYPNVYTSLEFERLNNATGPTGGRILMRDAEGRFDRPPESVAIVHCIGSRDNRYHEYCSRVCCMYALKFGHLIRNKVGKHAMIHDFYIDMRCFGKGYEEFYHRCQKEGIQFTRGKPAEISCHAESPAEDGKLIVIGEDTLLGRPYRVPVDMVILCSAMEARKEAAETARIFGISQGRDGFFLEEHPKLGPLSTATDGVFIAGACQSPKDIPDTVAQASGAAAKALSLATRGKVEIPSAIAWIDPDVCAGCQTCIGLCPYSAIGFDCRRGVSVVNEALCKGCGSCAGVCPSSAAQVRHFRKRQIFAEFDGIMDAIHAVGQ